MNANNGESSSELPPRKIRLWLLFLLLAMVLFLFIGAGSLTYHLFGLTDRAANFGDMFGAVNALFSGFAFAALFFALLLQREDLELQREELRATRQELKGQKQQMELQNTTLRTQTFEDTFFHLIQLHAEVTRGFSIEFEQNDRYLGRDVFTYLRKEFLSQLIESLKSAPSLTIRECITHVQDSIGSKTIIDHYFRSLYGLLRFIDESHQIDKTLYVDILRSQLSLNELLIIFYHGLAGGEADRLKSLIEKYSFFRDTTITYMKLQGKELYHPHAFQGLTDSLTVS
ncbi:MAG: putative phage abortive infection protein [Candidatus Lambdaproteobacteria bacterium]|nr:putative phage abortive infection protein [Candidatus Lambdaproteobacteria bacterium]